MSNFKDIWAKLWISYEKQDGCHHCLIERETRTGVAMETFDDYQHTYMCMLIIIRIMYMIKNTDIVPDSN